MEMKGSLFLRSNRTEYGPNVLVSNWDQRREALPKDYDFTTDPCRNAQFSTYKRFGTREDCPRTSYQLLCEQLFLKPSYEERKFHHPWHSLQSGTTFKTECPNVFDCVLPRHPPDHNKRYLETTHKTDYKPPYPYKEKKDQEVFIPDNSAAFKKCISQFTDTDGYRRSGQNTWINESGIYGNSDIKALLREPTLPELQPDICTDVDNHGQQCEKQQLMCKH